ncbi:hypothetical protein TNCV_3466931 [Trichonephila clavipes]|nr:hypothetical protein TNCV_3466931 [Trichonephila clavipes]
MVYLHTQILCISITLFALALGGIEGQQQKHTVHHHAGQTTDLSHVDPSNIHHHPPSGEILLRSRKQMKVTWCEIKTVWRMITPNLRRSGHLFPNLLFRFQQDVTVPRALMVPTFKKSSYKIPCASQKIVRRTLPEEVGFFLTSFGQVMTDFSSPLICLLLREGNGGPTIQPSSQSEKEIQYYPDGKARDIPGKPTCVVACGSESIVTTPFFHANIFLCPRMSLMIH